MKKRNPTISTVTAGIDSRRDSSKLVSLLALAAGAAAMPQTSNADIIFTDVSTSGTNTVGLNASQSFLVSNLPGIARIAFGVRTQSTLAGTLRVINVQQAAGAVLMATTQHGPNYFVARIDKSVAWGQINLRNSWYVALVGYANDQSQHFPSSYNNKYMAFKFQDSSSANAVRYGWLEYSLDNPISNDPNLTIFGYAYDSTGAQIPMGAMPVPEPSSMALMALGALALGAKGVRSWRRNRVPAE